MMHVAPSAGVPKCFLLSTGHIKCLQNAVSGSSGVAFRGLGPSDGLGTQAWGSAAWKERAGEVGGEEKHLRAAAVSVAATDCLACLGYVVCAQMDTCCT